MVWVQTFGGRFGNSYRYSIGLCYNPFVWPEGLSEDKKAQKKLSELAQTFWRHAKRFPIIRWQTCTIQPLCLPICKTHTKN